MDWDEGEEDNGNSAVWYVQVQHHIAVVLERNLKYNAKKLLYLGQIYQIKNPESQGLRINQHNTRLL